MTPVVNDAMNWDNSGCPQEFERQHAAPAAFPASRRIPRATALGLHVRKVRFLLPPELTELLVDAFRVGSTAKRSEFRALGGRTHKKTLGTPDSRCRVTPADAIRRADALRDEVCKDLGLFRARLSLASVKHSAGSSGPSRWLMDTGSGLDLIGECDVPRNATPEPADPISLRTGTVVSM